MKRAYRQAVVNGQAAFRMQVPLDQPGRHRLTFGLQVVAPGQPHNGRILPFGLPAFINAADPTTVADLALDVPEGEISVRMQGDSRPLAEDVPLGMMPFYDGFVLDSPSSRAVIVEIDVTPHHIPVTGNFVVVVSDPVDLDREHT